MWRPTHQTTDGALHVREPCEFARHAFIDRPLEWHDEVGEILDRLPSPGDEFGFVGAAAGCRDVDLAVVPGKAQRIPFLGLAAIPTAPGLADDLVRDVVGEPVR